MRRPIISVAQPTSIGEFRRLSRQEGRNMMASHLPEQRGNWASYESGKYDIRMAAGYIVRPVVIRWPNVCFEAEKKQCPYSRPGIEKCQDTTFLISLKMDDENI